MNPTQDKHIKETAPVFIVVKSLDYTPTGDRKPRKEGGREIDTWHTGMRSEFSSGAM